MTDRHFPTFDSWVAYPFAGNQQQAEKMRNYFPFSFGLLVPKASSICSLVQRSSTFFSLPRLPGHVGIRDLLLKVLRFCLQWNWPQTWSVSVYVYVLGGEWVGRRREKKKNLAVSTWKRIFLPTKRDLKFHKIDIFFKVVWDPPSLDHVFLGGLAVWLTPICWSLIFSWEA